MRSNHPAFELELEDQTLWVRALGVWTLRDVDDYVRAFRELVAPLIGKPWALVLDVRQWQTSPAEIFAAALDNSAWCLAHQLAHVIALVPADHLVGWQFVKATSVDVPGPLVRQRAGSDEEARQNLLVAGFIQPAKPAAISQA
ncbi:hypothetical protein [Rheinheimera texasensis]|uniref:hypothetical protein n=1 Tax=Rheinheimera texasensis TaxID=306205 RepID=UPI0032B13C67